MYYNPAECGKRIKTLREENSFTQMRLAEQIGINTDHLRAIERGRKSCSIDLLVDFAAFFEVSLDHLILGRTQAEERIQSDILQAIEILEKIKKHF